MLRLVSVMPCFSIRKAHHASRPLPPQRLLQKDIVQFRPHSIEKFWPLLISSLTSTTTSYLPRLLYISDICIIIGIILIYDNLSYCHTTCQTPFALVLICILNTSCRLNIRIISLHKKDLYAWRHDRPCSYGNIPKWPSISHKVSQGLYLEGTLLIANQQRCFHSLNFHCGEWDK